MGELRDMSILWSRIKALFKVERIYRKKLPMYLYVGKTETGHDAWGAALTPDEAYEMYLLCGGVGSKGSWALWNEVMK